MTHYNAYDILELESEELDQDKETKVFYNSMGVPMQCIKDNHYVVLRDGSSLLPDKEMSELLRICEKNGFITTKERVAKSIDEMAQNIVSGKTSGDMDSIRKWIRLVNKNPENKNNYQN